MQNIRLKIFKDLLQIVGILFLLSSCGEGIAYQIEGKLDNLEDQTLYAVFENDETKAVDTVTCEKKGEFLIKRKEGDFKEVTIYAEHYFSRHAFMRQEYSGCNSCKNNEQGLC